MVQNIFGKMFILALLSSAVFCLQNHVSDFFKTISFRRQKAFIRVLLEMRLTSGIKSTFLQISWLKTKISKN